ncbi:MAG: T9SS type A sorting domain-containing protein, partial [Candidatus Marinimicrobia bacterium]|nr:T9SS type A sorting domain-containing protein [Candidatus Neomarinimicrobiota bacterium]
GNHWEEPSISFDYYDMPAPEDTLSLIWHSDNDISNLDLNTVMFKVIPMDSDTGIFGQTGVFHVDNETGPLVVSRHPEIFGLWQDTIIIHFDRSIDTNSIVNNYEITSTKSGLITVNRSFSENHHSLFIVAVQPFVNDIVTVKLYGTIQDIFGNGLDGDADGDPEGSPIDDYIWSFETPYLGDYNLSDMVDIADLIIFANAWMSKPQDLSKEIGPVSGTLPDFILIPDHVVDFEDFVTLARMWNWSLGLGKISDMFTGGLGKMSAQQPLPEKPLQTVRRKDKYIDENRDLVFNRKSSVRRYADSPVINPKIPIIYLNPKISDDPWKNSRNGCFEIEVKLDQNIDVSGTELVLKFDPELISYKGYAKTQNEALTKANEIISNELFALEEEMQSNFDASEDKLIFERKEEGAVLLDIARLSDECIFANSEGNIVKLTFCVVSSGVSDIEYLYSVYNSDAKLLVNERSKVQIDSKLLIPEDYAIYQNYPNPFNSNTIIKYQIPFESKTTINIYDIMGRLVNTLVDERQMPGYYLSRWDGRNNSGQIVSSGMYI